jgi:hypothetical protein
MSAMGEHHAESDAIETGIRPDIGAGGGSEPVHVVERVSDVL